jgi:FixJ family two-component response regulator
MKNKTIAIIDDNEILQELIKETLEIEGYENIKTYNNGNEIIRLLQPAPKNLGLILLDNDCPEKNQGLNIANEYSKKIRTPIIMMSGYPIEEKAKKAGASYFFYKPFSFEKLKEIVQRYII